MEEEKEKEYQEKINTLVSDLSSLESYIHDLFTFSPLPILFVSPGGIILEVNPAFENLSQYKSYEIVGEGIEKIFGSKEGLKLLSEATKKEEIKNKEIFLIVKDQTKIIVNVFTKIRRGEKNEIVGFFLGLFDLREIKKKEKELQEKLEELEKFKRIVIGRELKMVQLKEAIEKLKKQKPS